MKQINNLVTKVIIAVVTILQMSSCEDPVELPISDFSMTSPVVVFEEVEFTNHSLYSNIFEWRFGDGTTSTDENPTHVYKSAGTFTVSLTATGPGGAHTLVKDLIVEFPVNIFPGEGAGGFSLEESWGSIKSKLNQAGMDYTQFGFILITSGSSSFIIHPVEVEALGIMMYFISVTTDILLKDQDIIFLLALEDPYLGVSEEGIGLGSTLDDVRKAYGTPDEHDSSNHIYRYEDRGIAFEYNYSSKKVIAITIYPGTSASGRSSIPDLFDALIEQDIF